jgi:hypothetical protein
MFRVKAPAALLHMLPKKPNPTNHLSPLAGQAFNLPSVGRVPIRPLSDTQTNAMARQTPMQPDLHHG